MPYHLYKYYLYPMICIYFAFKKTKFYFFVSLTNWSFSKYPSSFSPFGFIKKPFPFFFPLLKYPSYMVPSSVVNCP